MTQEEAKKYIAENKADIIKTDNIGRWTRREWKTKSGIIAETYTYKYDDKTIKENKEVTKYRNCFAVETSKIEIL